MDRYVIGFRNGETITLLVRDGKEFVENIVRTISDADAYGAAWYLEPGLMFSANDIIYVLPDSALLSLHGNQREAEH